MKNKVLSLFDYVLIIDIICLITLGVIFIYSSSINSFGQFFGERKTEYIKQIIWGSVGLLLMIAFTIYDYRRLQKFSIYLYIILIILLFLTRIFGVKVNGAVSWLGIGGLGIQPSEIGKIFFILFLAYYFDNSRNQNQLKRFIISLGILLLPMGLILIQPDMGTASVYLAIFVIIAFIADVPLLYLIYLLAFGILSVILAVIPQWNISIAESPHKIVNLLTNFNYRFLLIAITGIIAICGVILRRFFHGPKYIFWISYVFSIISLALIFSLAFDKILKDYQKMRLVIFLDPYKDAQGTGWNTIHSITAIGAGGGFGQGFLNGSQSHGRFLPQRSTDFIFSILSEESGFFGGCIVFILYFIILIKCLFCMKNSHNYYGTYIASGIFGFFAFHFFVNIGMVMGIMPITGIPLIFLSYGGSSILTGLCCIGILMSINGRRKEIV